MKTTKINRDAIRKINADIERVLGQVADLYGADISLGNSRYTDQNYTTKLTVSVVSSGGSVVSPEAVAFNEYKGIYGLDHLEVGSVVNVHGTDFEIVGLKVKARKYPIIGKSLKDGKQYKLPAELIMLSLQKW